MLLLTVLRAGIQHICVRTVCVQKDMRMMIATKCLIEDWDESAFCY